MSSPSTPNRGARPRNAKDALDFTGVAEFIAPPPERPQRPQPDDVPRQDETASEPDGITEKSPAPAFPEHDVGAVRALWDEPAPQRRRPLPRKALLAVAFGAVLLLLPLLLRHRSRHEADDAPTLPEDLVVSERDLKNRVEVSADDFRPRHPGAGDDTALVSTAPALSEAGGEETLAERRRRRAMDPEDLVAARSRSHGGDERSSAPTTEPTTGYERPYVYFERGAAASGSRGTANDSIAPAGTVVSAVLTSPIDLRGGTTTIVAQSDSDGPIPKTSRFVGSASSDGEGRLSLRFERLLLPDGREARIQGEAQDPSGAFGIEGAVATEGGSSTATSAARDVATDTATDVATETVNTLTGGLGGRLLRRAIGRASSQHSLPGAVTRRISLPAGARFHIFLHQAVAVRG